MPTKSQAQRGLIFGKRKQYGSKAKTPDKWKWIWDEDYENKGKLPKKVTEGSVGFEETRDGDIFIDEVIRYLQEDYDITLNAADSLYYDFINDKYNEDYPPDAVAEEIMKMENSGFNETFKNKNISMTKFRAKTVNESIYGSDYVSDDTRPRAPREEEENEGWTLKPGEKVEFDVRDLRDEFLYDEEDGEELVAHNRQIATVMSPETASEIGDRDAEYYNIKFDDGFEAYGVSGYHLFDI